MNDSQIAGLERRVASVVSRVARAPRRPKCFLMEWTEPPFCGGHWNPELVELASAIARKTSFRQLPPYGRVTVIEP